MSVLWFRKLLVHWSKTVPRERSQLSQKFLCLFSHKKSQVHDLNSSRWFDWSYGIAEILFKRWFNFALLIDNTLVYTSVLSITNHVLMNLNIYCWGCVPKPLTCHCHVFANNIWKQIACTYLVSNDIQFVNKKKITQIS